MTPLTYLFLGEDQPRFLKPSVCQTCGEVVSPPQSNIEIYPQILKLSHFSNQFLFPVEVKKSRFHSDCSLSGMNKYILNLSPKFR